MLTTLAIVNTILLVIILLGLFGIFEQNKNKDFNDFQKDAQKENRDFEAKRKSHFWSK